MVDIGGRDHDHVILVEIIFQSAGCPFGRHLALLGEGRGEGEGKDCSGKQEFSVRHIGLTLLFGGMVAGSLDKML